MLIWLLGNRGSKVQLMLQLGEALLSTIACVNSVHVRPQATAFGNRKKKKKKKKCVQTVILWKHRGKHTLL